MGQCLQNSAWKKKSAWVSTYNSILCPVRLSMKWEGRKKITCSLTMIFNYLPAMSPFSRSHCWSRSTKMREWLKIRGPGSRKQETGKGNGQWCKGRPRDLTGGAVVRGPEEDCPQVNPDSRDELRGLSPCNAVSRSILKAVKIRKAKKWSKKKNVTVASSLAQQQTINNKYFHNENATDRDVSKWNLGYSKRKLADNIQKGYTEQGRNGGTGPASARPKTTLRAAELQSGPDWTCRVHVERQRLEGHSPNNKGSEIWRGQRGERN